MADGHFHFAEDPSQPGVLFFTSHREGASEGRLDVYRIRYQASARLIEAPSGRVLWTSRCDTATPDRASRPTFSALEANQAALLKKLQDEAADECARQLRAQLGAGT